VTFPFEGSPFTTAVSVAGASDWALVHPSLSAPAWGGDAGDNAHLAYVSGGNLFVLPVDLSQGAPIFGDPVEVWSNSNGTDFLAFSPTISNDDLTVAFLVDEYDDDILYSPVDEPDGYNFMDDGDGTGPYQVVTFSHGGLDGDGIAVQIPKAGAGGLPEFWTSGVTPSDPQPSVDFGTAPVVTEGYSPSYGTDGRIAFGRGGDVWAWTPPVIEGSGTEEKAFDNGSAPSLAGNTFAFQRQRPLSAGEEFAPDDVFIGTPGRGISINVEVTDDNPEDNRLDLLVDCTGSLTYVGAVALLPSQSDDAGATWAANFDPSLTCENPKLRVAISDGYNRTLSGAPGTGQAVTNEEHDPTAAIYTPPIGSAFREYDVIPARGGAWDAEDGTLPNGSLQWSLSGPGVTAAGTGPIVDFSPPANGFPIGTDVLTLTLTVTDSDGNPHSVSRTITILQDEDNDGLTIDEETLPCVASLGPPDQDPLNAFLDGDGDGIPNVDDAAICTAATSYEAIVDVDADMVKSQPLGVVTGFVTLRYKPITQVVGSSVRITSINGKPANIPSLRWSVDKNGVGVSKFDKAAVVGFMNANGIGTGWAQITIAGGSSAGWTFEGSDLTNVH
jgi:hypothetical protein